MFPVVYYNHGRPLGYEKTLGLKHNNYLFDDSKGSIVLALTGNHMAVRKNLDQ